MATRLTLTLIKGCSASQLRSAIEDAALHSRAQVIWNVSEDSHGTLLGLHHNDTTHTAIMDRDPSYGFFAQAVGPMGIPWMELRIQEGSHWDYSLMKGEEGLGAYSAFPQYWGTDRDYLDQFKGNPELLADVWQVPLASIDRYHLQWGKKQSDSLASRTAKKIRGLFVTIEQVDIDALIHGERAEYSRKGKAYPEDKYEYGDYWQMLDFLRALGGRDPREDGDEHSIVFPEC